MSGPATDPIVSSMRAMPKFLPLTSFSDEPAIRTSFAGSFAPFPMPSRSRRPMTEKVEVKKIRRERLIIERKYPAKIIGFCLPNLSDKNPAITLNILEPAVTMPSAIPTNVLSKPSTDVR